MTAAIYTRYSSDRQRDTSLADQEAVCRRRADAEGWTIAQVYADAAISGSRTDRPQYQQMLADAQAGAWSVLLVEDLSRLSRDEVEGVQAVRRLEHRGVRVVGVSDGYDSDKPGRTAQRGVRALLSALYLEDLAARTHRGLEGQARRGYWTGGRAYGYRIERTEGEGSRLHIDETEAAIVRRIFELYADGRSPRRIVADLNADGILGPRSGTWSYTTLYGHPKKGTGILRNPIYEGRVRWNHSVWSKDPDTGRRTRRERPESEWVWMERPELRIVAADLWARVQRRLKATQIKHRGHAGPQHKHLLSGILKCGHCGGAMAIVGPDRYGCTWARYRGAAVCTQTRTVKRQTAERAILQSLARDLYSPEAIDAYTQAVRAEIARLAAEERPDTRALERNLSALDQRIGNLVEMVASGTHSPALRAALETAETERAKVAADLARANKVAPVVPIAANLAEALRAQLADLSAALNDDTEAARVILAEMLGDVPVFARDSGFEAVLPVIGQYAIDGSGGRI